MASLWKIIKILDRKKKAFYNFFLAISVILKKKELLEKTFSVPIKTLNKKSKSIICSN